MDLETCSWCTDEVEWSDLIETSEGILCSGCVAVARDNGSVLIFGSVS